MSARRLGLEAALVALALGGAAVVTAAADRACVPCGFELGAGSTLWIEGKSNLHDFTSRTDRLVIGVTRDSAAAEPHDIRELAGLVRDSGVCGLELRVPVTSLRSEKSGLDRNLWHDLRAEAQPEIAFRLDRYRATPRSTRSDTLDVAAEGVLRVAGRERPVSLAATMIRDGATLVLDGRQPLRMTEFGIKPRTMMLGALRVEDLVTIRYHLLLVPAGTARAR